MQIWGGVWAGGGSGGAARRIQGRLSNVNWVARLFMLTSLNSWNGSDFNSSILHIQLTSLQHKVFSKRFHCCRYSYRYRGRTCMYGSFIPHCAINKNILFYQDRTITTLEAVFVLLYSRKTFGRFPLNTALKNQACPVAHKASSHMTRYLPLLSV